jgi:predicted metal-dependent hydrolase
MSTAEQLSFLGVSADDTCAQRVVAPDERAAPPDIAAEDGPLVEVRRSPRRRRTVSAYRDGDKTVVLIPARMSKKEEQRWVAQMLDQLARRERKVRPGDAELMTRAGVLAKRYLDGRAVPVSVRWVSNQSERWGSCTPVDRTIRLSDRLLGSPQWVIDYVLLHELAHLIEPSHNAQFHALVADYPQAERARGWLEGFTAADG